MKTEHERNDPLVGIEFDWFALDVNLNLALFSTAGYGPIPKKVLKNYSAHQSFGDILEEKSKGNNWSRYTKLGLFVYDWCDKAGAYKRVAVPKTQNSDAFFSFLPENIIEYSFDFLHTEKTKL